MDQVSYRGYARSIGFDPIKAPTEGLSRMQERDNRVIRNMEENRRAVKEVRDDYARGLERKLNIESQDRDRNYLYEKSLDENRQKFVEKNSQTLIQNELQRSKNVMATFESLSKFSTTLGEVVTEYKKQQTEQQKQESIFKVASGQIPLQQVQEMQNLFALSKAAGESNDKMVEGFQKRGLDPYLISSFMSSNPARKAGIVEQAGKMMFSQEWPSWSLNKLNERGLTTAEQRSAAAPALMQEFMKEKGFNDVNPMLLTDTLQKALTVYGGHIESARKADIRTRTDEILSQETKNLISNQTGEQFMTALKAGAITYQEDAATPLGLRGSREYYYNILSDSTLISDEAVQNMLSTAMTDNGQSMKDRYPAEYDALMEKRRTDANQEAAAVEAVKDRENKAKQDQLLEYARTNNLNEDELTTLIKQAKVEGIPTDLLQAQLAFTTEQQNADFWTKTFREAEKNGTLTAEDVYQAGVPGTVRQQFLGSAQDLDRRRSNAGIDPALVKAEFTDELKRNLIGDSTDRAAHFSLRSASAYAYNLYTQKFKQYSETMEPSAAAAQARNDVLTAITKKSGRFAVITSAQGKTSQAFYGAFTPGKHPNAPSSINIINTKDVVNRFNSNRNIINEEVIVSPALLKDIDNRIANGKPFSMPEVLNILQRAQPGTTATDLLNAQLKAAGLKQRVQSGFRDTLSRNIMNDPVLQRIFAQSTTQDRLNTTIIGSGSAPATVRTGNNGYADVAALGTASGFKFPQVMAAMWALESGWGKYTSGKNNVFNIKARPGQGTQKNGSYWRDYPSPLESAKDFMNLMTDPRYAPGLAKAKTPRQAIEAIAAGGYAGGEAAYPSKIIRVMQQMGVNVDQPYNPAPPARNQAFMRPTLAYITSDLGSPGQPHLDVKQQDNPNTPQNEFRGRFKENELDQFVVVQDPEFGMIPVGDLRKRLPGRGDSFDQHMARGSHGIDYPTAYNSKVFVRNGARIVSKQQTRWGSMVIIQLPDGRRFSFLHGKSV
jgi:hypothetical protein